MCKIHPSHKEDAFPVAPFHLNTGSAVSRCRTGKRTEYHSAPGLEKLPQSDEGGHTDRHTVIVTCYGPNRETLTSRQEGLPLAEEASEHCTRVGGRALTPPSTSGIGNSRGRHPRCRSARGRCRCRESGRNSKKGWTLQNPSSRAGAHPHGQDRIPYWSCLSMSPGSSSK